MVCVCYLWRSIAPRTPLLRALIFLEPLHGDMSEEESGQSHAITSFARYRSLPIVLGWRHTVPPLTASFRSHRHRIWEIGLWKTDLAFLHSWPDESPCAYILSVVTVKHIPDEHLRSHLQHLRTIFLSSGDFRKTMSFENTKNSPLIVFGASSMCHRQTALSRTECQPGSIWRMTEHSSICSNRQKRFLLSTYRPRGV